MKHVTETVRLPSSDDAIGPVMILDGEGRVMRVISADEFRRDHATVASAALRAASGRHRHTSRPRVEAGGY